MNNTKVKFATGVAALLFSLSLNAQTTPLSAGEPIPLPGTAGGYDFIQMDAAGNRLLLGHEGNHSFDVFDLKTRQLVKVVPTGTSQDAAADVKRHLYYVSGNDPGRMVIVDSRTLAVTGQVPLPDDSDLIGYDPKTGLVHICDDKAAQQWIIDPVALKIVATITFDGKGMEDMALDLKKRLLYQAVKGTSTIAAVDLDNNQILAAWPLAPDKGPHGIALVPKMGRLLVACAEHLVMLDTSTGKIVATAPIGGRVDEMAYDPKLQMAYCASRQGKISVVAVKADSLTAIGDVPDAMKTGDITVDPKTHTVWIAYQQNGQCFAQPFTPGK
jgi:DNA-binding beta-propeller fold protein YncE